MSQEQAKRLLRSGDNSSGPSHSSSGLPLACIILAAGRDMRMGSGALHKVCLSVAGGPVINQSIAAYRACGIGTIVVVVGQDDRRVIETVMSAHDNVLFVRQRKPLGTGDAVRVGFQPLAALGFDGNVICAVGDKLVRPEAVRELLRVFLDTDADGVIAIIERPGRENVSRVLLDEEGGVDVIVEKPAQCKGALLERFRKAPAYMNETVHVFRAPVLARALPLLRPQPNGEVYFTDIAEVLARPPRALVRPVFMAPGWLMGYNTPDEFRAVLVAALIEADLKAGELGCLSKGPHIVLAGERAK